MPDAGEMVQVHRWAAAAAQRVASGLAEVADGQLVAVYLHGSAVLGGWVPGRSDVDVLIIAADEVNDMTLDSMAQAIVSAAPARQPDAWPEWPVSKLETSIVTTVAARAARAPWPFLRHVVTDPVGPARIVRPDETHGDRDLLMHYVACRAAGYAAFGPPPLDLIGAVARADVLSYLADDLRWGLANAPERYSVLNACRARLYLTDDVIVSKVAGGQAALERRTGPAAVITRALAQQQGTQPDRPASADAVEFIEGTVALILRGA